jgi:GNAT superfamily N-acetyltransferase
MKSPVYLPSLHEEDQAHMFTIRDRVDQDIEACAAIFNRIQPEPVSAHEMRNSTEAHAKTSNVYVLLVAEALDGTILAYGLLDQSDEMPPGWWYLKVQTHPDHKGKGAGAALYARLEAIAREGGAAELVSYVRGDDDQALAWAEARSFRSDRLRTESVLDLTTFDRTRFVGAIERAAATGIRFEVHSPTLPETDEFLNRLYDLHAETLPDVPIFVPPFPSFDLWVKQFRGEGKEERPVYAVYAYDGERIVGESSIGLPEVEGAATYTFYTAVRKAYRGRGLALGLKLLTIEAAIARGFGRMRTNNDPDNPAMLAVNEKLGYVLVPGPRRIMKSLEAQ